MEQTEVETENVPKRKRISWTMKMAYAHPFMIYEVTDPELRSQLCYYRNKKNQEQEKSEMANSNQIQDNMMEQIEVETETAAPKRKRISWTMKMARAHRFMIYDVTDPELRSQMCCYRNKDKEQQEQEQEEVRRYEEVDA